MVDGLLKTNGILTPWVISGFLKTPREMFCLRALKSVCYHDGHLPFSEGRVLLSPLTIAQMLEISNLSPKSNVMVLASGAGYMASILATYVNELHVLEKQEIQKGSFLINSYPVIYHEFFGKLENHDFSSIDVLFVDSGSITKVSPTLLKWLKPNGALIAIMQENELISGPIVRVSKNGSRISYHDACAPLLPEFRVEEGFIF